METGLTSSGVGPALPRQGLVYSPTGLMVALQREACRAAQGSGKLPQLDNDRAVNSPFLVCLIDIGHFLS